jgi:hypothetical protein
MKTKHTFPCPLSHTFDLFEYELKYKADPHVMTLIEAYKALAEDLKDAEEAKKATSRG